jgi:hypothetical protein
MVREPPPPSPPSPPQFCRGPVARFQCEQSAQNTNSAERHVE